MTATARVCRVRNFVFVLFPPGVTCPTFLDIERQRPNLYPHAYFLTISRPLGLFLQSSFQLSIGLLPVQSVPPASGWANITQSASVALTDWQLLLPRLPEDLCPWDALLATARNDRAGCDQCRTCIVATRRYEYETQHIYDTVSV